MRATGRRYSSPPLAGDGRVCGCIRALPRGRYMQWPPRVVARPDRWVPICVRARLPVSQSVRRSTGGAPLRQHFLALAISDKQSMAARIVSAADLLRSGAAHEQAVVDHPCGWGELVARSAAVDSNHGLSLDAEDSIRSEPPELLSDDSSGSSGILDALALAPAEATATYYGTDAFSLEEQLEISEVTMLAFAQKRKRHSI